MTTSDEQNRRTTHRMRTLKGAEIVFNGGFSAFECVVKDLSDVGARIMMGDATGVPDHFELVIPHDKLRRKCTVRWRRYNTLGVSFDTEPGE